MEAAMAAVRGRTWGLNKAAKEHNVPKATLKRHLDNANKFAVAGKKHLGRRCDLPEEVEQQLVEYILQMESRFYGINTMEFRKLAFQIAEINGLNTRFNKDKQIAGKEWADSFIKPHQEISLPTPKTTSLARASGFNRRVRISAYFDLLEKLISENQPTASKVYNMDEMGIAVVQKVSKVLAKKEKHQVGTITRQERGQNVTAVCCMNASGNFIPPAFIFPLKRMKPELMDGAPPESLFSCQVCVPLQFLFYAY